jgi:hypothetical protein
MKTSFFTAVVLAAVAVCFARNIGVFDIPTPVHNVKATITDCGGEFDTMLCQVDLFKVET